MNLLVSTNVYKPGQLARVIPHLHAFRGQIGVELFPMFDADCYEEELLHCLPEFEGIPVSFHGPYYETEHSAAPGTPEYAHSMDLIRQTLPYCVRLQSQYLVFHHNNIPVTEERREEMIRVSRENYREIAELFKPHQIPVVVENAGVLDRGNMLFDQDAFIQLCREEHYPVLIDIGHAYANGWDLEQTMEALKDQIVAYHLHNNDGVHDSHQRIFHGTLDFPLFLSDYQRLTPNADLVCPVPFGYVPDCGSICQMITNATGQVPHYIGKPSTDMVDIALRENPFSKEETVIVGDRFYTDIACGNASGVETVLVLTGEAKKTDTMIHTYSPTYIFDSIKEVKKAWKN